MDGDTSLTVLALVIVPIIGILALGALFRRKPASGEDDEDEGGRAYTASSVAEAHLVRGLFEAEGIGALVKNELLAGAIGELPMMATLPEVWLVRGSDAPRAREVLAEYKARAESTLGADVKCPACGEENPSNFELCWKCRQPLPT